MKSILRIVVVSVFCSGIFANQAKAQDVHFSQFYQNPLLNNPALTGIFNEDYKVGITYRNQWSSLATPFRTTVVDAETKVHLNNVNDYVSFGLLAFFDKAGTIDFNTNAVYPAINYNKSIEDKYNSYISVGFTAGFINRTVDPSKMTFDNQYINGGYDPNAGTGENISTNKLTYWDLGAGVTFNSSFDENNTINYFLGFAAYHITKPTSQFSGGNTELANLNMRLDATGGLNYEFDYEFGGMFYANVMMQKPYQEIIVGGLLKWTKPDNSNSPAFTLYAGGFYRYQDAVIPTVKIRYKMNTFAFSYDYTSSSLKSAIGSHGAYEVSVFISGSWGGVDDKHLCPRF